MKKKDRPLHRPQHWQNTKEETGIFICTTFVPKETECTYYYFASYNVNSQTVKNKSRGVQANVVRENKNTHASG